MMATRSQTVSTSPSSCEEKKTVLPSFFKPLDDFAHFHAAERIQAAGRLVEDQQVGIVDQRLGQADALLHAFGIGFDRALAGVFQFDEFQQLRQCAGRSRPWEF